MQRNSTWLTPRIMVQCILFLVLLAWYGFFLAQKTNLITADLGRHIKNGEIILHHGFSDTSRDILATNFYSYTNPQFPFLNHHWLGGVIFFLIHSLAGFTGISIFFILLSLATFALFFFIAHRMAGFSIPFALSLILIPLIAERVEIRPEGFSYLFIAIFFLILWQFKEKRISWHWLLVLPVLELLWVNLHVYFFFGILLIILFLLDCIIACVRGHNREYARQSMKQLACIVVLSLGVILINPAGLAGALYPLTIFNNYGYLIVENQSIWFLKKLNFITPNFLILKTSLAILAASFAVLIIRKRDAISFIPLMLAVITSAMAMLAMRNFTLFALFAIPIAAANISTALSPSIKRDIEQFHPGFLFILSLVIIATISFNYTRIGAEFQTRGLGLAPNNNASSDFFLAHDIKGPLLNNYDIGGYLIYNLAPKEKVFVDNRPEAYPNSFFQDIYIPLQENEHAWERAQQTYHFNAIFFAYRDYTPWAQRFLVTRIQDPAWAPVFADNYAIIFLKRNELNADLIAKFEIPKNRFSITPQ
ncbi:MAG: hypothetical protein U1A25_00570 [Candidatus Sungbacteria bacterium]|nr:hypothetical protein [bacterium]MDZ4260138.1 hypothetical protein [Candidatus Sungbacteria bacterium]